MNLWGWAEFALAFVVFAGSHFLPARGGLREALIAKTGRRAYFAGYGMVSLLVLIWLIAAAGRAPYVEIWPPVDWTRRVPGLLMPVAVFLAVAAVGTRSPFTLGSKRGGAFDPADPGLAALTRHPLLWALTLWSVSHLPPNGDLAHVLLFGGFAVMSLAAMSTFDRRAKNALCAADSARLFRAAPLLSARCLTALAWLGANGWPLTWRLLIAWLVWGAALMLHLAVIGVSPFS